LKQEEKVNSFIKTVEVVQNSTQKSNSSDPIFEILNHAATVVANAKVEQLLEKVEEHKKEIKKEADDKPVQV